MSDYRTNGNTLSSKQMQAIEALLVSPDATTAAIEAGVCKDTMYRYLKEPAFQTALRETQSAALEYIGVGLLTLAGKALRTLNDAMDNPSATVAVKVRAADAVLSHTLRVKELIDLESRMRSLEGGSKR